MIDIDLEDLDPEILTLCQHCAKHPTLKRFICSNGKGGIRCGICLNVSIVPDTCDPGKRKALIYLIRSLVRFFYSEDCYNRHWGGEDSPVKLLQVDNSILENEAAPGFPRDSEHTWLFLEDVFGDDVYPPCDEGVAVYAGHDQGIRLYNQALPYADRQLGEFRRRLKTENYFPVEPDLAALIEKALGGKG